jgi:polysaccharide biosynthesis transport protein
MTGSNTDDQQARSSGLPFEPITVLIGLLRRWKIFAAIVLASFVLGAFMAVKFGTSVYEAESVLLFTGGEVKDKKEEEYGLSLPLSTQINMVKIASNLEKVRQELGLNVSNKALGQACKVEVEKKTSLVTLSAQWNSAKEVAAVVNGLRNTFLAGQVQLAREKAAKQLEDVDGRFQKVSAELKDADQKLQQFISSNKIVDLGKEVQWNLEQLTSHQLLLTNATVEKETLESQRTVLLERMDVLKERVASEKGGSKNDQSLADLNIKIERLRRAIHDDKVYREDSVDLTKYRLAYDRAKELFNKGLISKADLEKARAEFEVQQVKSVDTTQIEEWKRQLKILEAEVVPPKEQFKSPAQDFLQNLQVKALDLDLQTLALGQKIASHGEQINRVKSRLEVLTDLQRQYATLTREVSTREAEKMDLEKQLAKVKRAYGSNASEFLVISEAQAPAKSVKSNRVIIFAVIVVLGFMVGFSTILALELLDTTIRSGPELQHKFSFPLVGTVPHFKDPRVLFPDAQSFPLIELFRIISRHLRHDIPKRGARILITSADRWEGKTLVTANLAACLGRQDERVLVMDTQMRDLDSERDLRYLVSERDLPLRGLADYLTFRADSLDEILWPTVLPGVECIPRIAEPAVPDLLTSNRMRSLLEELSEHFSVILIDGQSMAKFVDAELVAQWCDAVVLVVRSRICPSSAVKDAVERLRMADVPIIRFIVNDVDGLYISRGLRGFSNKITIEKDGVV